MKKMSMVLALVSVLIATLTSCNSYDNSIENIEVKIGVSNEFTREEIKQAIDIVIEDFFKNSDHIELHSLSYDEEFSNSQKEPNGNVEPNNEIIISSDFYVDRKAGGAWSPNTDYNWMFILSRVDENSNWTLDSWGY